MSYSARIRLPGRSVVAALATASIALALLAAPGCKPKPPVPVVTGPGGEPLEPPSAPKQEDEQAANALVGEAEALEAEGKKNEARAKRDMLIELYAGTTAGGQELEARARAAEEAGDVSAAIDLYEKLLFFRPSFEGADAVRERYARLLLRVDREADAANMLRALYASAKQPSDRERLGLMLAGAAEELKQAGEALHIYVDLHSLAGVSSAGRQRAEERALDIAASQLAFKEAEDVWDDVENKKAWDFVLPTLAFKLAKVYYHVRDYERSEEMLRLVSGRYAMSPYGPQARDFLARLRNRFKVRPHAIGVLLPLSGRYQQYGSRALEAIKLAMGKDSKIELVVRDTAGSATQAAKEVENLVLEQHVIAIVGPLFSNEAMAAALKAEELSVPLITLSFRHGLPQLGPWIFRTALTVEAQAHALARVAFEDLGMTRFALLYPRSRYGETFANAFWDEVDRRRGEIRAVESYEHNETSFQEPVRKLVGRFYMYSRTDYRDAINVIKRQNLAPHRRRMAVEKLTKTLPPVTDFDAIVIPDSGRNIGLIAPALAFEDIVMTRDPKMLERISKATGRKDIRPVSLLGASTWNSMQTVQGCERYCENAIFVDGYYPDSPSPKVRDFVTAFRDATGADPYLSEAQAHDTAGIVKHILSTAKPADRKAFRDGLAKMPPYEGGTGTVRFASDGEIDRKLMTLTITDGVIRPWVPEAEEPKG